MEIYLYVVLSYLVELHMVCPAAARYQENCHVSNGGLDCSYKHISSIDCCFPEYVTNIDLSFNDIESVPSRCFKGLQNVTSIALNRNKIKYIDSNAFIGLKNLITLMLNDNNIRDIPSGVFKPLTSLQSLILGHNSYRDNLSSFQKGVRGVLYLKQLQTLSFAVYCELYLTDWCTISQISQKLEYSNFIRCSNGVDVIVEIFKRMTHLTDLRLTHVKGIRKGSFQRLVYLKSLFIELHPDNPDIYSAFQSFDVFAGRNMTLISVTGNNYLNAFKINRNHFRHIQHICLKQLILKQMFISHIDPHSFQIFALKSKCLELLDISKNPIATHSNNWMLYLCFFPRLKVLKASHFKRSDFVVNSIYHVYGSSTTHYKILKLTSPVNLEELHITYTFSRFDLPNSLIIRNGNNAKVADLAYVGVTACNGTVYGLPNLQFLDMSGWNCSIISENILSNFPKLQTFIARESFLGIGLMLNIYSFKLFKKNLDLRHIDLSKNGIHKLPSDLLGYHLRHLQFLNLSNNMLQDFPVLPTNMSKLKVIDLRSNNFENIPSGMRKVLDQIHPNHLYLSENPFQCSCKNTKFLMWLKSTKLLKAIDIQFMKCITEKGTLSPISSVVNDITNFSNRCESKAWIIIVITLCSIVLIVIIVTIIYIKYKYAIEYMYIRIKMKLKKYKKLEEDEYEFDAFVSYSHLDTEWVLELNNVLKNRDIAFCFDAKDFIVGHGVAENVVKAINKSRKVIFVITENFLKSSWGSYELEMTRMHAFREDRDNMVIVIMKDEIPLHKMPRVLRDIWYKIVCIKWHNQPTNEFETKEWFYNRLHEAVLP